MSDKHDNSLLIFEMAALSRMLEMAALSRMLDISRRDKIRNVDIRERLVGIKENLVQKVCQRRHTWLGHIWRINNERIAKFALEGKQRVGKPKRSWLPT